MRTGWEKDEVSYRLAKSILCQLKRKHLLTENETEKCREEAVKTFKPLVGSLDGTRYDKEENPENRG